MRVHFFLRPGLTRRGSPSGRCSMPTASVAGFASIKGILKTTSPSIPTAMTVTGK